MSYEGDMLAALAMPAKSEVKNAIITALFKHNGSVKEFSSDEETVAEIADSFALSKEQRETVLERIYHKENRIVKTPLWHRLLYRAADALAKEKLVTRPADTMTLTHKKEWLLTEKGIDHVMQLLKIPVMQKETLLIKSFETQKEIKSIIETPRPENYVPFERKGHVKHATKIASIRSRGFRQAVIESYDYACCVCGLKINTPDALNWEVEAAPYCSAWFGWQGRHLEWPGALSPASLGV